MSVFRVKSWNNYRGHIGRRLLVPVHKSSTDDVIWIRNLMHVFPSLFAQILCQSTNYTFIRTIQLENNFSVTKHEFRFLSMLRACQKTIELMVYNLGFWSRTQLDFFATKSTIFHEFSIFAAKTCFFWEFVALFTKISELFEIFLRKRRFLWIQREKMQKSRRKQPK